MTHYDDGMTLRAARAAYFEANRFGGNGGYDDDWVRVKVGGFPMAFPNVEARKRAVRLHDLHHLATGYETSSVGEGEIGAWELSSGCKRYWAAWVLNLSAVGLGFWVSPARCLRAVARGRRSRNLYDKGFEDAMLDRTVGELKRDLSTDQPETAVGWRDVMAYAGLLLGAVAVTPVMLAIPLLGVVTTIASRVRR